VTPAVSALLDRIRRRLRWAWAVTTAELVAPIVAMVALLLVPPATLAAHPFVEVVEGLAKEMPPPE